MQKFRSKKDWWILGFIIAMTGLLLQLLLTMYAKGSMAQYPVHTLIYVLTIAVLWWPVWSTQYRIEAEQLVVSSMFLTWKIPLSTIQKISPSNNSVSSPALSLDRLRIDYQKEGKAKFILISPKDKQAFTQALQQAQQSIS
ncbi:MAG TPA: PH domain-containing protein [Acinetobacter sp.]|nr:PH domain-containing protein [Acinetobacter sp.]